MDVSKITTSVRVRDDGAICLRINGYVPGIHGGVYVELPYNPDDADLITVRVLAADIENALATLLWIHDHPDDAAAAACIPVADIDKIKQLRKRQSS